MSFLNKVKLKAVNSACWTYANKYSLALGAVAFCGVETLAHITLSDPATVGTAATDFFTRTMTLIRGPIRLGVEGAALAGGAVWSIVTIKFMPVVVGASIVGVVELMNSLITVAPAAATGA